MAIAFANAEYVSRSKGGNACCKGAYNARDKITDLKTGKTYNFSRRTDNVFHEILLPDHADQKFKDSKVLMNEVERTELKVNSQLLKEYLLALPDEKNVSLEMKKEMVYEFIKECKFIEGGLGVQIDIHKPCKDEKNWHAHLLVTTRKFSSDGTYLDQKARDLEPQVRGGRTNTHVLSHLIRTPTSIWTEVQNRTFEKYGMENRVDLISTVPGEHIGPVRMRNILNQAVVRNEIRKEAHIENMKDGESVLARITRTQAVFTLKDLEKAVKDIPDLKHSNKILQEAKNSDSLIPLNDQIIGKNGEARFVRNGYFTTKEVRQEEERILRISDKILSQSNYASSMKMVNDINRYEGISDVQREGLKHLLLGADGVRVLRGRAGTGKSHLLGALNKLATNRGQYVIGLAPTHKAKLELRDKGYEETNTVKGFLFAIKNGRAELPSRSTIVVDEAGMVSNRDLQELLKCAHSHNSNVIMAGDERQLTSVERGGLFQIIAERFGSYELSDIRRQTKAWSREMASCFAGNHTGKGIDLLLENKGIVASIDEFASMSDLIMDWSKSKYDIGNRLIVTVRNHDANRVNNGIREVLKLSGVLSGREYKIETKEIIGDDLVTIKRKYMKGDRILFTASDKDLGISNGEFGTLVSVDKEKFVARLDNEKETGKEVSFKPGEISIKNGYAVTTYKSQGASIQDVYTLHNGAGNCRTTYVGLTRHIESARLYYNTIRTPGISHLKMQLSMLSGKASSLTMFTQEDIAKWEKQSNNSKFAKIGSWFKKVGTSIADNIHRDHGYYEFEKAAVSSSKVEEVLTQISKEIVEAEKADTSVVMRHENRSEYKEAYGGSIGGSTTYRQMGRNFQSTKSNMTEKQKFYSMVDRQRSGSGGKSSDPERRGNQNYSGTREISEAIETREVSSSKEEGGLTEVNKEVINIDKTGNDLIMCHEDKSELMEEKSEAVTVSQEDVSLQGAKLKMTQKQKFYSKVDQQEKGGAADKASSEKSSDQEVENNKQISKVKEVNEVSFNKEQEVFTEVSKEIIETEKAGKDVVMQQEDRSEHKGTKSEAVTFSPEDVNLQATNSKMTQKEKFYSKVDKQEKGGAADKASSEKSSDQEVENNKQISKVRKVRDYNGELEMLKNEMKFKVETIARTLLGEHNKQLSNRSTLRYGKNGSLAVGIRGAKSGTWYDFEESKGGDLISLVERETKQDFKGAVEYLKQIVGVRANLRLVSDNELNNKYAASIKESEQQRNKEIREAKKAVDLHTSSKNISKFTVAGKYLANERGITVESGADIKTTGVWDKGTAKRYPAIVAFARSTNGEITGGQTISLAPDTAKKADIDIVKKSFGKIGGSFVEVQKPSETLHAEQNEKVQNLKGSDQFKQLEPKQHAKQETQLLGKDQKITFIAEGLETALSIKEAKVEGKILCSLGIGNIRNYLPKHEEKIIICADNDGADSKTSKTIEAAAKVLQDKGAIVQIVTPEKKGDFNDVLKQEGVGKVREHLKPAIIAINAEKEMGVQLRLEVERFTKVTALEFTAIDKAKEEAKSLSELLPIMTREQKYATELAIEFPIGPEKLTERKLNPDAKVMEAISKDSNFLIKNKVVPEERLFRALQKSDDFSEISKVMFKESQDYARVVAEKDVIKVGLDIDPNNEDKAIAILKEKKLEHQELKPYLKDAAEGVDLRHLENRLKVYEIVEEHSLKKPGESQRFKDEMQSLNHFSRLSVKEALETYKEKGLTAATSFAHEANRDGVISRLESQHSIFNIGKGLKGQDYVTAVVKDDQIMKYVDSALSSGKKFSRPELSDNSLADYAKERDAYKTLGPKEYDKSKEFGDGGFERER